MTKQATVTSNIRKTLLLDHFIILHNSTCSAYQINNGNKPFPALLTNKKLRSWQVGLLESISQKSWNAGLARRSENMGSSLKSSGVNKMWFLKFNLGTTSTSSMTNGLDKSEEGSIPTTNLVRGDTTIKSKWVKSLPCEGRTASSRLNCAHCSIPFYINGRVFKVDNLVSQMQNIGIELQKKKLQE